MEEEVEDVEDDNEEEEGEASEKDDMEMLWKRMNTFEDDRQGNSPVSWRLAIQITCLSSFLWVDNGIVFFRSSVWENVTFVTQLTPAYELINILGPLPFRLYGLQLAY